MVFRWSLSDSKSIQVTWTLLSILTDLNNAVISGVSIRPPISNSSSLISKLWGSFQVHQLHLVSPSHSCFTAFLVPWQGSSICRTFRFLWFLLCGPPERQNPEYFRLPLFCIMITRSCLLVGIRWSVSIWNPRQFYASHSPERILFKLCSGCPRGVMVKAIDWGIVVREFELQSRYYVHFRANTLGKGMNPLILPAMG